MKIIQMNVIKYKDKKDISYRDFHLYYVLKGKMSITVENNSVNFSTGEMIAVNPDDIHSVYCRHGIAADLSISYSKVLQLMGYQRKLIICNTHTTKNENSEKLSNTVNRWLRVYYEPGDDRILEEMLSLQIVYQLITHFSSNAFIQNDDDRKNEIVSYIEANYANDLTLGDVSNEFALTPQYFSKYFKSEFGIPFLKYLNQVRLKYATDDLLAGNTTILKIAINNGFPNVASFNREFKETYGMTPMEYRVAHIKEKSEEKMENIRSLLEEEQETEETYKITNITIDSAGTSQYYNKFWNEILNVGSFEMMMKNHMMDQVLYLQKNLKFKKARLLLDTFMEDGKHHYYAANAVMEFFVTNHMDLIIVIDMSYIHDRGKYLAYLRAQCLRFVHRFGEGIQNHTVFELVYNTDFTKEALKQYYDFYHSIQNILKECHMESEIMGPGMLIDGTGENFRKFVRFNPYIKTYTLFSAPFAIHKKGQEIFLNRLTDSGYLLIQYKTALDILKKENRNDTKVLLTSWKDRLNDIDVLNETPYMGARIIHNVLAGYELLSSLPLDKPLDLMFDEFAYEKTFNLLPGVLTTNAIPKPSYHALKLLDQQDNHLVYISKDCLATKANEDGFMQILLHNCKNPGWRYYSNDMMGNAEDYSLELFEDIEVKTFHLTITGLKPGEYLLKCRKVSDEDGNAFANYLQMNYPNDSFIGLGEMNSLKSKAVIPVTGEKYQVNSAGILDITCTLKANEFRHYHLIKVID